jgi:hypothetical protein
METAGRGENQASGPPHSIFEKKKSEVEREGNVENIIS